MALPATDDFTGNTGDALPVYSANWTTIDGEHDIQANAVAPGATGENATRWNADTFAVDQSSKLTITQVQGGKYLGVGVRFKTDDSDNRYGFYGDASDAGYLFKVVAGSWTQLGSTTPVFSVSEVVKIEANGTTIRALVDDVEVRTNPDSAHASGSAGLAGFGDDTTVRGDDWVGDDLGAPPAVDLPVDLAHTPQHQAIMAH